MNDENETSSGKFTICRQLSSPITIQYKGSKSVLWALLEEKKVDKNLKDMDFISNMVYTLDDSGKQDAVVKMHHEAQNYNKCRMIYTQKHVGKEARALYRRIEEEFKLAEKVSAPKPIKVESKSPSGRAVKVSPTLSTQTPSPQGSEPLNLASGYYNDTSQSTFTLRDIKTGVGSVLVGNKQGDRSVMAGVHQINADQALLREMERKKSETIELKVGPAKNDPTDIEDDIADAPVDDEIYDVDSDLENEALTACGWA